MNLLKHFTLYEKSLSAPFSSRTLEFRRAVSLFFVVCLLFCSPLWLALAENVHIPDSRLRAAVEFALDKEAGADITRADMESLEVLQASKSDIRDLTGIEFATNLTKLELGDNRIPDVSPLKKLTNLTRLRLGANYRISDVSPLAGLTNLIFLDIDSNRISDVSPLKKLTNLTWLDLDDNGIVDVSPLKGLANLKYLDLDGNRISNMAPLKELTNLIFLDIDENEISDISALSALINLTVLDLEGNKISDISVLSTLINLTELDLHNNRIIDVSPLRELTKLKILDLSENHITDFSPIAGLIENLIEYNNSNQKLPTYKAEDVNRDGIVDVVDLVLVAFNYRNPDFADAAQFGVYPDVNDDEVVDVKDIIAVATEIEITTAAAPALSKNLSILSALTAENLSTWIFLAKELDIQEPRTQRGVVILEQLLAFRTFTVELPRETGLLANYPNPFNPETWIPYQLSEPANVSISIYSVDGQLVRELTLGHLPAGMYHSKSRAAYWDGRNTFGEPVASGVYFYTLTADDFNATAKMFIQK